MNTCKDCLCYDACHYHIDEETNMTVEECSTGFKHKDRYAPAYIGQPIWCISSIRKYENREFVITGYEIVECKVSMLQQKADKSWKVRVSMGSSIGDYTADEFDKRVFATLDAAKAELEKKLSELVVEPKSTLDDWFV
jgi:hypothetical protein